jgi:protein-tyrosine phosphatase
MKTVLFLCTGNYYRSRFAEELFNHHADRDRLDWIARSRALALERGRFNIGPISPFALSGLVTRGLIARGGLRFPRQCADGDLAAADRIIALCEAEHRPLMTERFPQWESTIAYWQVEDIGDLAPHMALGRIERQVGALIDELRQSVGAS